MEESKFRLKYSKRLNKHVEVGFVERIGESSFLKPHNLSIQLSSFEFCIFGWVKKASRSLSTTSEFQFKYVRTFTRKIFNVGMEVEDGCVVVSGEFVMGMD